MPYIKKEERDLYDSDLKSISEQIDTDGQLNYCITKLLNLFISKHGLSYTNLAKCVSSLECAKLEFYRRTVAKYEDVKIVTNGDVYNESVG